MFIPQHKGVELGRDDETSGCEDSIDEKVEDYFDLLNYRALNLFNKIISLSIDEHKLFSECTSRYIQIIYQDISQDLKKRSKQDLRNFLNHLDTALLCIDIRKKFSKEEINYFYKIYEAVRK